MKKQIAVYTQIKTEQDKENNKKIINYILEKNNLLDDELNIFFYEDIGYSGKDNNRPDLNNLLLDIENQKINLLITPTIETLSKDPLYLDSKIFSSLIDFNVELITFEGKIDVLKLQLPNKVFRKLLEEKYGIFDDESLKNNDFEISKE